MQQWILRMLVGQLEFDVWDVILSEMEDTIAEGFRGRRQLPYAHWITYLIRTLAIRHMTPETLQELKGATIEFLDYNITQLLHHSRPAAPHPRAHRPIVTETAAQQDERIREIAESEEAQLEIEP